MRYFFLLLIFRFDQDDDRIKRIEDELKEARTKADNADKQYDEVSKKLQAIETDLERAEERGEMGETKIMELEEELKVVTTIIITIGITFTMYQHHVFTTIIVVKIQGGGQQSEVSGGV